VANSLSVSVQLATMFVQLGRPVCNTRVASSTRNTAWTGCHCTHTISLAPDRIQTRGTSQTYSVYVWFQIV